jgi:hypothetical protein
MSKENFDEIVRILSIVESKIKTHNEFKKAYNKQLAFDFSLFNFFNVGENKVSEILAYFLNEKESHGQGDIFLRKFVDQFHTKEIDISSASIICEKVITKKRRIDIFISLKNEIIAIENKIWADDQVNQLNDYAKYLEKKTKGNFLLLYLNPYGNEPTEKSIDKKLKVVLTEKKQLKTISYQYDILNLIDNWLAICEAENVCYFIREFKKFLKIKFLGNNTLNMAKSLREIIYENQVEIETLVYEYKSIENEVITKLNTVGKALDKENPKINKILEINKVGPFNWKGLRVYKYSLSKGNNKIWLQIVKREINLSSSHYFQEGTEAEFIEISQKSNLNKKVIIDYKQSKNELIKIFLEQVYIANSIFKEYDNFMLEK